MISATRKQGEILTSAISNFMSSDQDLTRKSFTEQGDMFGIKFIRDSMDTEQRDRISIDIDPELLHC